MTIKSIGNTLKSNIPGAIIGGVALHFASKKLMKIENKYAHWGLVLVGAIAGAIAQSKMHHDKAVVTTATGTATK